MNFLQRLIDSFRGEPLPDPLSAVRPKVTPDPEWAESLKRLCATRSYCPKNGFHRDQRQERSNVVQFRRRVK